MRGGGGGYGLGAEAAAAGVSKPEARESGGSVGYGLGAEAAVAGTTKEGTPGSGGGGYHLGAGTAAAGAAKVDVHGGRDNYGLQAEAKQAMQPSSQQHQRGPASVGGFGLAAEVGAPQQSGQRTLQQQGVRGQLYGLAAEAAPGGGGGGVLRDSPGSRPRVSPGAGGRLGLRHMLLAKALSLV